jgi:hypothetical protein
MEITTIHEHSVILSLLPEKANILDLGCRGFQFTNYFKDIGHNVFPVDIDLLHPAPPYYILGIGGTEGFCAVKKSIDPQAAKMTEGFEIPMHTVKSFSEMVGVEFWDIIKADIEGSEYEMIMSWEKPWCRQLSVEFHQHLGQTDTQIKEMEDKLLSLGYLPAKHDKYPAHGLPSNYWDSLWLLKEAAWEATHKI